MEDRNRRPNHYHHDSLGDPAKCTGDHNHPEPDRFAGLPPEVVAKAREAKCTRCAAVVVDEKTIAGTVMFNYYVPSLGVQQRGILCGNCGLLLREFLYPQLLENPTYQAIAARIRSL